MKIKKKKLILFTIIGMGLVVALFTLLLIYQDAFFRFCFTEKVYAHRVNSIEKYTESTEKFYGVECDVYFDSEHQVFTVTHDLEDATGLILIDLLKSSDRSKNLHFWLDYTNLNEDNCQESLGRLNEIVKELGLNKSQFIVESKSPELLKAFSKDTNKKDGGYFTSYYLEPYNYKTISKEELQGQAKVIRQLYKEKIIHYISSDSYNYDFIREHLPDIPFLSWSFEPHPIQSIRTYINRFHFLRLRLRMLMDDKVGVLLFGYTAKEGNL